MRAAGNALEDFPSRVVSIRRITGFNVKVNFIMTTIKFVSRPAKPNETIWTDYATASAWVRAAAGVKRLTPKQADDVRAGVERHLERLEARRAEPPKRHVLRDDGVHPGPVWVWVDETRMNVLRDRLAIRVRKAVAPLMDKLFRAAESRWAGGETENHVTIDATPKAEGSTDRVRSANGKWPGTNVLREVTVQPAWRTRIRDKGLAVLDGMLTTHARPVAEADGIEVYEAAWVPLPLRQA